MADNNIQNNQNANVSDYQGLADLMMSQFGKVYERFEKIDERFEKIEKILDNKADKSDIDRVLTRVVLLGGKIDDYRAEQIGMQKQSDKHEKWHNQTAAKLGLKLQPE